MAALGTGGPKESTEWDDILRSKGIIPEKTPEEIAEEQLKTLVEDTVESYDPHERKDLDALEEDLEEADSDEERILESYRQKRLQQMRDEAMKPRYGPGVAHVSANEWKSQVTEAGTGVNVIVHLFQAHVDACKLMDARLVELSGKFPHTKFVRCKATDAIKNYPDAKCPTLLIYKEGKVVKQFVGFSAFKTNTPNADDIEWALSRTGAVETEMAEPPNPAASRFNFRRV